MARAGLDRNKVLDAAVALVDEAGLEALSMRKLGEKLGVEAMSLYRHVANKADLLDGVHARILAEMPSPTLGGQWQFDLRMLAQGFQRVLLMHPRALPLFAARPAIAPGSLDFAETALAMFRESGFTAEQALSALNSLVTFVVGHCLLHHGGDPESAPLTSAAVDPETHPHLASLGEELDLHDVQREFEFGLDLLLDGLRQCAERGKGDLLTEMRDLLEA